MIDSSRREAVTVEAPWTADVWRSPLAPVRPYDPERARRRSGPLGRRLTLVKGLLLRLAHGARRLWTSVAITVDVDEDATRIVVIEGRRVVRWQKIAGGHADPAPATSTDRSSGAAGRLPEDFRAMLKETKGLRSRLMACFSVSTCLLRHFDLPGIRGKYVEPVMLEEVYESVPFSESEVDVAWQRRKNGSSRDAFAVVAPRSLVDGHISLFDGTGTRPLAVYPRASALAAATGLADAIIVDARPGACAIILVQDGFPRVVHQPDIAAAESWPQLWADAVARAVEQVAAYGRSLASYDRPGPTPVAVIGELAGDRPLIKTLSMSLDREVMAPAPALTWPEHFPAHEYAANLGLAIQDRNRPRLRRRTAAREHPAINMLPERHLPRPLPLLPAAILISLLLAAYVGLMVKTEVDALALQSEELAVRASGLERRARAHSLALARAGVIEQRTRDAVEATALLEADLALRRARLSSLISGLRAASGRAAPSGVDLSSVVSTGADLVLSGSAATRSDVFRYVSELGKSSSFTEVKLQKLQGLEDGGDRLFTFHVDGLLRLPAGADQDTTAE